MVNVNKSFNGFLVLVLTGWFGALLPAAHADDRPSLTLPEVLTRHLQALGNPQNHAPVPSERVTGTIQADGLTGTYVTVFKGHDRYWSEEKIGLEDQTYGSDGKVTWERDANGSVRLLSSEELKNDRNGEYVNSVSYALPQRMAGAVTLRPQTERRTGDYVLDIVPDGGRPATLFLDPKTFLIAKEQHRDDDRLITTEYSNYKSINGEMTAGTRRISGGDRRFDVVYTLTDDQFGVEAPDSLFAMPPSPKNYQWEHPNATSATIAFDGDDQAIKLYVGINGRPAFIMLDSGASTMALAKFAADTLHLQHQGTMEARGYGGSTNIYPVKLDTFELPDGLLFRDITATAIDLPYGFDIASSVPTVGLLGYTLLSRFVVKIDYGSQEVTLLDPDGWTPGPSDGQPLPMELEGNVPTVSASFDGLPQKRFLIDTGDSGCVHLYAPYVADNKLSAKYANGIKVYEMGVGGVAPARRVRARSFSLAGTDLRSVPTDLALDDKAGASRNLAGALGHQFLSRFVVTFDYPHQRIFFAACPQTQKPFDTRTFGVYLVEVGDDYAKTKRHIVVVGVDPKSPAFDAGLSPDDVITQVDGQSAETLGLAEVRRLLSPDGGKDVRELSVIGARGGTGKVRVRMYDPLPPVTP